MVYASPDKVQFLKILQSAAEFLHSNQTAFCCTLCWAHFILTSYSAQTKFKHMKFDIPGSKH